MATALSPAEHLTEARSICKRLNGVIWFSVAYRFDPVTRNSQPYYRIFRRGMGEVATRASPAALVSYLRRQLPP